MEELNEKIKEYKIIVICAILGLVWGGFFLLNPVAQTPAKETKNNIAQFYLANPLGRWGIELKSTGEFIGTIDLHKLDTVLKKATIGYIINQKYWNQGLTTEANRVVIELALEKIGMNKLDAFYDKDNPASGKVMEKSGMRFSHEEPYARMDKSEPGRFVTDVHYVLTKEDYFANK